MHRNNRLNMIQGKQPGLLRVTFADEAQFGGGMLGGTEALGIQPEQPLRMNSALVGKRQGLRRVDPQEQHSSYARQD